MAALRQGAGTQARRPVPARQGLPGRNPRPRSRVGLIELHPRRAVHQPRAQPRQLHPAHRDCRGAVVRGVVERRVGLRPRGAVQAPLRGPSAPAHLPADAVGALPQRPDRRGRGLGAALEHRSHVVPEGRPMAGPQAARRVQRSADRRRSRPRQDLLRRQAHRRSRRGAPSASPCGVPGNSARRPLEGLSGPAQPSDVAGLVR